MHAVLLASSVLCFALFIVAPMAMPVLLPVASAIFVAWRMYASPTSTEFPLFRDRSVALPALFGVYLVLNALQSLAPAFAFATVGFYVLVTVTIGGMSASLTSSNYEARRALAMGFLGGFAIGVVYLLIEIFTARGIRISLTHFFPSLVSNSPDAVIEDGIAVSLPLNLLNRSVFAFSLSLWFALFVTGKVFTSARTKALFYGVAACGVIAVMASDHQSSQLACIGSAVSFLFLLRWREFARRLIIIAWVIATLMVVPICMAAYALDLYRAPWLQSSAQQRIVLWDYTARKIAEAPVFGVGIGTPRVLQKQSGKKGALIPGTTYVRREPWHSHNVFLQIWYETGAVGAILFLVLGLAVLKLIAGAAEQLQPYLYASFVIWAILASSTFSPWALWFMASTAIAILLGAMCISITNNSSQSSKIT